MICWCLQRSHCGFRRCLEFYLGQMERVLNEDMWKKSEKFKKFNSDINTKETYKRQVLGGKTSARLSINTRTPACYTSSMLVFPVRQTCQVKNLGYISHQTLPLGLHHVSPLTARKDVTLQKHQWLGAVAVLTQTPSKRRCGEGGGRGGWMHHQTGQSLFEADKRLHQYSWGGEGLTSEIQPSLQTSKLWTYLWEIKWLPCWLYQWISRRIPLCRQKISRRTASGMTLLRRPQLCNLAWCKCQGCRIRGGMYELHIIRPCFDLLDIFSVVKCEGLE